MTTARPYQAEAMSGVLTAWRDAGEPGTAQNRLGGDMSAVCLVSPTGSGKTFMGSDLVRRLVKGGKSVLWIAHRTELIDQAAKALSKAIGQQVSTELSAPLAQVFVASIQTLIASGKRPKVDVLVIDECHHCVAEEWKKIPDEYSHCRILGLTATPTRLDEIPLGVTFGSMVNAAHFSELLEGGHLVDCTVYAPPAKLEKGLALDPLDAYEKHAKGLKGFVYVRTKVEAEELAARFTAAGVPAGAITDSTPKKKREGLITALHAGTIKVLTNVYTLTEGVDIPSAQFVMLARNIGHISMFLQIVGRGLRTFPGKDRAVVIDLVGAMREHGFPTENRYWDLMSGKLERGEVARCGVECPECMAYFMRASKCPECGHDFTIPDPDKPPDEQRVFNVKLQCVTTAAQSRRINTSPDAKADTWKRLQAYCESRNWSISWAVNKYRLEYCEEPGEIIDSYAKTEELKMLVANAVEKNHHAYSVAKKYKDTFNEKADFTLVDCEKLKEQTMLMMRSASGGRLTGKDRAIYLSIFKA